mmetsp:Transcript_11418/g.24248  ORF Transcript_11418/g.24248 Transcript_11418/m.24248 type:complete len:363 (-) Transcript_11418:20-1108(-)
MQRHEFGQIRNDLRSGKYQIGSVGGLHHGRSMRIIVAGFRFASQPTFDAKIPRPGQRVPFFLPRGEFVEGGKHRSHGSVPVAALAQQPLPSVRFQLQIPGADVVNDGVPPDVLRRIVGGRESRDCPTDDDAQFDFVVELGGDDAVRRGGGSRRRRVGGESPVSHAPTPRGIVARAAAIPRNLIPRSDDAAPELGKDQRHRRNRHVLLGAMIDVIHPDAEEFAHFALPVEGGEETRHFVVENEEGLDFGGREEGVGGGHLVDEAAGGEEGGGAEGEEARGGGGDGGEVDVEVGGGLGGVVVVVFGEVGLNGGGGEGGGRDLGGEEGGAPVEGGVGLDAGQFHHGENARKEERVMEYSILLELG